MAKPEKLLKKIRENPKAVSFDDLDKVLRGCGFVRRQPRGGSSHDYYTCNQLSLSLRYKRLFVGTVYVKQALALIEQAIEDEV